MSERIPPRPRDEIELTTRDLRALRSPPGIESSSIRVAVIVAAHRLDLDLSRCVDSIIRQEFNHDELAVVILFDSSDFPDLGLIPSVPYPRTWIISAHCGSAARARNALMDYVEAEFVNCEWIARLDWDDCFHSRVSLRAAVALGDQANSKFVLGGNRVISRSGEVIRCNPASQALLVRENVVRQLEQMSIGEAENEIPSCNLLIRCGGGFRYPDTGSAEDHWLVVDLLMNHGSNGAILEEPLYVDYSIDGAATDLARVKGRHSKERKALYAAAATWLMVEQLPGIRLGHGQEGVVRLCDGTVYKHFYPGILSREKCEWLNQKLSDSSLSVVPPATVIWSESDQSAVASYPWEPSSPFDSVTFDQILAFLSECLERGIVCANIKRSNFRIVSGRLVYIDIGNWLISMDVSYFLDSAARLYSIGVLGNSDEDLMRRRSPKSRVPAIHRLAGFSSFYAELVERSHETKGTEEVGHAAIRRSVASDVTLLVKTCAMDFEYLEAQAIHIVEQLIRPRDYSERILLIDCFRGPFLRAHGPGDFDRVVEIAKILVGRGYFDRFIVSPDSRAEIRRVNDRWFSLDCEQTHSSRGVPVTSQLWAFDQVATRYVLQCDVDVFVVRRDCREDYLVRMREALKQSGVVSVGFGIAKGCGEEFQPYAAPIGLYKPEVRCGLLDLARIRALCPLPNRLESDRLNLSWYQSLLKAQEIHRLRSLRGGSASTFYFHPTNDQKNHCDFLDRVRVASDCGVIPDFQNNQWDVQFGDGSLWPVGQRSEPVIVVSRGRDISAAKIKRYSKSLAAQHDQSFGVILIDDASVELKAMAWKDSLQWLGSRLTHVRNRKHQGRSRNLWFAIRELCSSNTSMIVILDQDDAFLSKSCVSKIRSAAEHGNDVVLAAPFRPDAPLKLYQPNFENPRSSFGGDVWIHLRAFSKALYDQLDQSVYQVDGQWVEQCEDYATMIPIVELAKSPLFIPEYLCLHERSTFESDEFKMRRDNIIRQILCKEPWRPG